MSKNLNRARLLEPYSALTECQVRMINTLVEEDPDPMHVERALNNLLDEIEARLANASEMNARSSIANAAVDVAPALAHLPPLLRSKEARARVNRLFSEDLGSTGTAGSSDDGDDGFEAPQRVIAPGRKTREGPEL